MNQTHLSHRLTFRLLSIFLSGLLLLLLTGLFSQTQVLNINRHYKIIEQLRSLERSNLVITADALKTEFSLLNNYDTLVASHDAFHYHLSDIKASLSPLLGSAKMLQQPLDRLKARTVKNNFLLEDFKSEHAVLKNSTAYFPNAMRTLLERLPAAGEYHLLRELLENLFREILLYSLNGSAENAVKIEQLIEQIEARNLFSDWQPAIANVLQHSQIIVRLKPEVNRAMSSLADAPTALAIDQLAAAYQSYHQQIMQTQNRYRLLLYIIAIALILCSLYLVWHRHHAVALKQANLKLSSLVAERTQDLRQALEKLKRSQAQLIQTEKMSGLGQLSAGIAHEINNPISFIHGNLQISEQYSQSCLKLLSLYEQHYPNPVEDIQDFVESIDLDFVREDWDKLIKSMTAGTVRVQKIVESLRNFSRLDESDCKSVDLHEGLESTLLLLKYRLESVSKRSPVKVVKNYGNLPTVLCCPSAINQVFMNVLTNAIDAFGLQHPAPKITICTVAQGENITITIADNGSGIPETIQTKIFDPFFTSKPVGQGVGLGLTTSYQTIVEAHNGQIGLTSEPGVGTEFWIRLPRQHCSQIS